MEVYQNCQGSNELLLKVVKGSVPWFKIKTIEIVPEKVLTSINC